MESLSQEARKLYARRDRLQAELTRIDAQLDRLRGQYMRETSVYGIHPTAFRREVEAGHKRTA